MRDSLLLPVALTIVGTALFFAQAATAADPAPVWVAGNDTLEVAVNRTNGRVERLLDKAGGVDYCNQTLQSATSGTDGNTGGGFTVGPRFAGLRLIDELRRKEFSDLEDPGRVSNLRETAATLSFDKRYPGAEFVVTETFRLLPDHLRWDVRIHKTAGPDRTIRVIQFAPLPLGTYEGWAPISDAPFAIKPWMPFSIDYGQSTSGAVGEGRWRTCIPMMVFYSKTNKRALSFTSPFEVPAVRIRFLTNTGAEADFHWNSRRYPEVERPYFLVSNEYLGVRDKRDIETGLLVSVHPADWRPALGFIYDKYRAYFDADPSFDQWDGTFVGTRPRADGTREQEQRRTRERYARGARWEELHGHFPWYGLMIPPADLKSWSTREGRDGPADRDWVRQHARITREAGVGLFLYYNTTESVYDYATEKFPDSVAKDEGGNPIGAWRIAKYPSTIACWLMNSDPSSSFGKHMIAQAREMVEAYPEAAGFFWDVYGRSYMFDFAHDDGITMVNNKPVYYPEFMYQRLLQNHIRPLLRSRNMLITANKPVSIASCKGVDGIMAMENAPFEDSPPWITAQSYLGLTRHVMILDSRPADAEMMYLHCLRYGMFDTDVEGIKPLGASPIAPDVLQRLRELKKQYRPYIDMFRGKRWIFHPQALELPKYTEGNIFRLRDGKVMVTMVSAWRYLRNVEPPESNLEVICRLPDASKFRSAEVHAIDLGENSIIALKCEGDTIRVQVPKHAKATVILMSE